MGLSGGKEKESTQWPSVSKRVKGKGEVGGILLMAPLPNLGPSGRLTQHTFPPTPTPQCRVPVAGTVSCRTPAHQRRSWTRSVLAILVSH